MKYIPLIECPTEMDPTKWESRNWPKELLEADLPAAFIFPSGSVALVCLLPGAADKSIVHWQSGDVCVREDLDPAIPLAIGPYANVPRMVSEEMHLEVVRILATASRPADWIVKTGA